MRRMLATFFSEAQYMDAFVSHLKNMFLYFSKFPTISICIYE